MKKVENLLKNKDGIKEKNEIYSEKKIQKISQKIIDYAIWYYLKFFPSKRKLFDKLKEKFGPESEKGKKFGGISDEEIFFIIDEKLKNILQEENILRAKIENYFRKGKNLNYIKIKLFEKKFEKDDIERIFNENFEEFENKTFENLKKEFEKISKKKVKNKKTGKYEEIGRQKIIEKLLGKGFFWDDVKKLFD